MEDLGFVALLFELLLLAACASLCASFVFTPTEASTARERLQWRQLSTVAASAAAAATEEVFSSPSPATIQVIRVAAQAASAATATALAQDQMNLESVPWVAAASADHAGGEGPAGRDQNADVARRRGGVGRGRGEAGRGWGVVWPGVERPRRAEAGRGWDVVWPGVERPRSGEGRKLLSFGTGGPRPPLIRALGGVPSGRPIIPRSPHGFAETLIYAGRPRCLVVLCTFPVLLSLLVKCVAPNVVWLSERRRMSSGIL